MGKQFFIVILCLGLIIRLFVIPISLEKAEAFGETFFDEYGGIARNIVDGYGFSYNWHSEMRPTSIHSPLYPYLLATIMAISGSFRATVFVMIGLNIIVSLSTACLIYWFCNKHFSERIALLACAVFTFYPTQVYYAADGTPTVLYQLMLLGTFMTTYSLYEHTTNRNALAWGGMIGISALSYSMVLGVSPLLAVFILFADRGKHLGARLGVIAIGAATALLICLPWTIRNYCVHQRIVPIRDQAGTNLWWGNGPYATGGIIDLAGNELGVFPSEIASVLTSYSNEVDADRYLYDSAVTYMWYNKSRTLKLWGNKLLTFWWFRGSDFTFGSSYEIRYMFKMSKAALIFLSFTGFVCMICRKKRMLGLLAVIVILSVTFSYMLFHTGRVRYFVPLESILVIGAAYGLEILFFRVIEQLNRNKLTTLGHYSRKGE